ncbi:Fe-S-containing hydro-lyase [Oceanobacillus halophilus]|uniref:Fe-S-containing hydro-lyase n=1 Tax=Oceanobacillus halophilus TaxID=930130 RepID=A0A495A809_9BACI|nr:Fe-S-containing hydro-lyase [Oceanobacillus halophilus]RKQ35793.1 Fe-S-containing hydro-lyase [Oceanobacillus halophilus]
MPKSIKLPLDEKTVSSLRAGDQVRISGTVYTARDAAHMRMAETLDKGLELPFDINGQVIYYVGPTPAKPGQVIGSAGPTTSSRMDAYTPKLLELGLKGMIGKGYRNDQVKQAIQDNHAVYFAAVGGSAALIAKTIKSVEVIAYEDLGIEAIRKMEVEDFPAIVINDMHGGDYYQEGVNIYRKTNI